MNDGALVWSIVGAITFGSKNIRKTKVKQTKSNIRRIMESKITELNKVEFRRLFMEDKMWSVMKNMPDWLNNTWLSLSAFAQKTK